MLWFWRMKKCIKYEERKKRKTERKRDRDRNIVCVHARNDRVNRQSTRSYTADKCCRIAQRPRPINRDNSSSNNNDKNTPTRQTENKLKVRVQLEELTVLGVHIYHHMKIVVYQQFFLFHSFCCLLVMFNIRLRADDDAPFFLYRKMCKHSRKHSMNFC